MFPRSVQVHAPLVHHRNRILYTSHQGWAFNTLHFTCSIFHWQHHTTFNLQYSHLVTPGEELWRLLVEIHTCHGIFITNLRWSCLNVRADIALTIFSISPPHFSMTMFPCSLRVHAPLVHHRNRILYTSHHGWVFNSLHWQFTPLSITCSIFHWQHHTTSILQCSHLITHEVELWRLLEEIHTCHCTFTTNLQWS